MSLLGLLYVAALYWSLLTTVVSVFSNVFSLSGYYFFDPRYHAISREFKNFDIKRIGLLTIKKM